MCSSVRPSVCPFVRSFFCYQACEHCIMKMNERYDTIRYDSVYLTCSKKLTGSQLSLPHGINKKLKCETKNKIMSVIGPVQSRYREAVQLVKEIYGGKDLLKR